MRGVALLIERGANVQINITLTKQSLGEIELFVAHLQELGITSIKLNPLWSTGNARYSHELFYSARDLINVLDGNGPAAQILRDGMIRTMSMQMGQDGPISCGVGDYLTIAPNGDVFPCHTLTFERFKAANVRDTPLLTIWSDSEVFRRARSLDISSCTPCGTCDYRRICRGGCRGIAFQDGDLRGRLPIAPIGSRSGSTYCRMCFRNFILQQTHLRIQTMRCVYGKVDI